MFDYENFDDSDLGNMLSVRLRRVGADVLDLEARGDRLRLRQKLSGVWTTLQEDLAAGSLEGTKYTIRAELQGSSVKVWRKAEGAMESLILDTTTQVLGQAFVLFAAGWGDDFSVDNIRILADDLSRTTTFTSNNANELTSVADYNGTTAIAYDAWGRTTSKTRGTDSMTYEWAKGNFLTAVDATSWGPIGQRVEYDYRGDARRYERSVVGGDTTRFHWGGWSMTNEEDSLNGLEKTYIDGLAEIAGAVASTGTYSYYSKDHLGSTRGLFDPSKNLLGDFEYTPYGSAFHFNTSQDVTRLFTGHQLDPITKEYFAPLRYLNTSTGRWLKNDPLGMIDGPNMFGYVAGNPVRWSDPSGGGKFGDFWCWLTGWGCGDGSKNTNDTAGDAAEKAAGDKLKPKGSKPQKTPDWKKPRPTYPLSERPKPPLTPRNLPNPGRGMPGSPLAPIGEAGTSPEVMKGLLDSQDHRDNQSSALDLMNDPNAEICYGTRLGGGKKGGK